MNWFKLLDLVFAGTITLFLVIAVFLVIDYNEFKEESFCDDLNEWCNCFNGRLDCDLNINYGQCDYLCEGSEMK